MTILRVLDEGRTTGLSATPTCAEPLSVMELNLRANWQDATVYSVALKSDHSLLQTSHQGWKQAGTLPGLAAMPVIDPEIKTAGAKMRSGGHYWGAVVGRRDREAPSAGHGALRDRPIKARLCCFSRQRLIARRQD
jgi:hypothetical protein